MTNPASTQDNPTSTHAPGRRGSGWVQTERSAHEAWAQLAMHSAKAAALLHMMVARMGTGNALVVSQKTLASLMGCHERTVRRLVAELVDKNWIQTIQIGQAGSVNAYVVNSAVAWGQPRDELHTASFTATVLASASEQSSIQSRKLKKISLLYSNSQSLS